MSIYSSITNPIRFYKNDNEPDFYTKFPFVDNITQRQKYNPGVYPSKFYKDFIINQEISFQLQLIDVSDETITLYKPDGTTSNLTPTNITPSGWTSAEVKRYDFTPTQEGVYYMIFSDPNYISDKFVVHSKLKFREQLIEIQYRNSENDYGLVFYDGSTLKFTGKTYFTGKGPIPNPGNEISAFVSDRGNLVKLRSTPTRDYILELIDIHYSYIDNINHIFSCDYLLVNGMEVQSSEVLEPERVEDRSDLYNITINISIVNNNYFIKEI